MNSSPPLKSILYLDDDITMRMLVELSLDQHGINVTACDSAEEFFDQLGKNRPQMIVLDAIMPDINGEALFARLRQDDSLADIPVVFITGKSRPEDIANFIQMGAKGVITKPIDLTALPGQFQTLWRNR